MDVLNNQDVTLSQEPLKFVEKQDFLQVSCNWKINNNKKCIDTVNVAPSNTKPENIKIDDIVSLDTCICVEPKENSNEQCMIDIKVTNGQRISHIAVVSGAYIIEFFKQYGEYEKTVEATIIDDFSSELVCFAETAINPNASEASIKFAKRVWTDTSLWIYGIKIYLTESVKDSSDMSVGFFNPEIIKSFLSKCVISEKNIEKQAENPSNEIGLQNVNITTYIDNKFQDLETRLTKRINDFEERMNQKLESILEKLQCIAADKVNENSELI